MTAQTAAMSHTWMGSLGSPDGNKDSVLKLHRTLFIEKRGTPGVNELVETRRKERVTQDHRRAKEFASKMNTLNADIDDKFKNALQHGSMTIWTKAEHDRIEEARRDPDEAISKMTRHIRDLAAKFKKKKSEMSARVQDMPSLNLPPSFHDEAALEKRKQAGKEAMARTSQQYWRTVRELQAKYAAERQAFTKTNTDAIIANRKEKGLQEVRRDWHAYMDFIDEMEDRLDTKHKNDMKARSQEGQERREYFEERQKQRTKEVKEQRRREVEYWQSVLRGRKVPMMSAGQEGEMTGLFPEQQ